MYTQTEEAVLTSAPEVTTVHAEYSGSTASALPQTQWADSLANKPRVLEKLVIEEVSIDGMCGVY